MTPDFLAPPLCILPRRARAGLSFSSVPGLLCGTPPASVPQFIIWNTGAKPRQPRTAGISPPPTPSRLSRLGGGARDVSGPLRGRVTLCGGQRGVGSVVRGGRLRVALSPPRPRTEQMAGEASGRVSCCYLSLMTRSVNFVGNTPSCLCMPPALITVIEL